MSSIKSQFGLVSFIDVVHLVVHLVVQHASDNKQQINQLEMKVFRYLSQYANQRFCLQCWISHTIDAISNF